MWFGWTVGAFNKPLIASGFCLCCVFYIDIKITMHATSTFYYTFSLLYNNTTLQGLDHKEQETMATLWPLT